MKYIIIIGASENGKSTTINEVCKRFKPTKAWELNSDKVFVEVKASVGMYNRTYLIEVNGILILVAAGSPTEQDITITDLVKIALKSGFNIKFLIVAMRTFEKKSGFNTPKELEKLGTNIYQEKIYKIDGDYKASSEWNNRVNKIVSSIEAYII